MGGFIGFAIPLLATALFYSNGRPLPGTLALLTTVIALASWLLFWHAARSVARDRLYVAALESGKIKHNTPEAEEYWRTLPVLSTTPEDAQAVPDALSTLSMLATLAGLTLLVWALVATSTVGNWLVLGRFAIFAILESVLFAFIGPAVLTHGPVTPRVHDFVNPVKDTLLITGGGALLLYLLKVPLPLAVVAFVMMFCGNVYATLGGRYLPQSLRRAGIVFLASFAVIALVYFRFAAGSAG